MSDEIITRRDDAGLPYAEKADGSRVYLRDVSEEEAEQNARDLLAWFEKREAA